MYKVKVKISKDIINTAAGVGTSNKIPLQKTIFIINKSIFIHNLFYQNSPFYQAFYLRWQINVSILKVENEILISLKIKEGKDHF